MHHDCRTVVLYSQVVVIIIQFDSNFFLEYSSLRNITAVTSPALKRIVRIVHLLPRELQRSIISPLYIPQRRKNSPQFSSSKLHLLHHHYYPSRSLLPEITLSSALFNVRKGLKQKEGKDKLDLKLPIIVLQSLFHVIDLLLPSSSKDLLFLELFVVLLGLFEILDF